MNVATSIKGCALAAAGILGMAAISSAVGGTLPAYHEAKAAAAQKALPPPTGDKSPGQPIQPGSGWNPVIPPTCDPTRESCVPPKPPIGPIIPITCTGPICRVRYHGESPQQTMGRFAAATECPITTPPSGEDKCPIVSLPGGVSAEQYELEPDHLPTFEGFVPHMYVDTTGNVTVGYGNNLTANGASSVTFYTECESKTKKGGCICDKTHACTVATPDQVNAEYKKVKDIGQPASCTRKIHPVRKSCHNSTYYKRFTSLLVSESESLAWMAAKLDATTPQLVSIFPEFNTYPPQVQAALYDMIYNMGAGNYCKRKNGKKVDAHCKDRGLLSYQKFIAAIKAGDWMVAAKESHRDGISRLRNEYVAGLLVAAKYNEIACHGKPIGPVDPGSPVVSPPGSEPPARAATKKTHSAGGKQ